MYDVLYNLTYDLDEGYLPGGESNPGYFSYKKPGASISKIISNIRSNKYLSITLIVLLIIIYKVKKKK